MSAFATVRLSHHCDDRASKCSNKEHPFPSRFEREAQALAALKHPHIAAIYIEDSGGMRALVLELAKGATLADRLARGAIPVAETIAIARQLVDALEAAHEHVTVILNWVELLNSGRTEH